MKQREITLAIADDKRYKIIELLLDKPQTVEFIAAALELKTQLSADFKILLKAGILDYDKKGHHRLYKVKKENKKPIRQILKLIDGLAAKGTEVEKENRENRHLKG